MDGSQAIQHRAREVFGRVGFRDEGHKYSLNGVISDLPSVSSVYKRFIDEPDWDLIAERKAAREGIHKDDLIQSWHDKRDEACDRGHRVHQFAEDYAKGLVPSKTINAIRRRPDTVELKQKLSVMDFFDGLPSYYEVILLELQMYHDLFEFFGMTDVVLRDHRCTEVSIVPLDHKTNEDIFKQFGLQCLAPPFQFLADMPYNHYQLQLSLYQILIEQMGYDVADRIIAWHKHDGGRKVYHTQDFTRRLREELKAA